MSSAPRSAGTESISAFREELNKLLPRTVTDGEVLRRVMSLLASGESIPVDELARRVECPAEAVLRVLNLPEGTSLEQTVRINVETAPPPTTKRPAPRRK